MRVLVETFLGINKRPMKYLRKTAAATRKRVCKICVHQIDIYIYIYIYIFAHSSYIYISNSQATGAICKCDTLII
jgi:hypothetical protein